MYFITRNPPINSAAKARESQLKYFSMNERILSPLQPISPATRKNLAERLTVDATRKPRKFILATPADIVQTL